MEGVREGAIVPLFCQVQVGFAVAMEFHFFDNVGDFTGLANPPEPYLSPMLSLCQVLLDCSGGGFLVTDQHWLAQIEGGGVGLTPDS
jgi:hypothetical protein